MRTVEQIRVMMSEKGLKVTPQRIRVLEEIYKLDNHPTADDIIRQVHLTNPNIASGTVYNVLDTLVENGLIKRVKTEHGVMHYDGDMAQHHHIYCAECDHIDNYHSEELDELLRHFFEQNKINNFSIDEVVVNISGRFIEHKKAKH